ncbi:MotA/TolQ/ExbB proton channel family protein [Rhodohalobacter sp.]|uniref:MotA/TolQ/ExbB proton channel family protein n=1 Tax=Rhodohalobacter sp. TaxID=1974210 RepID=UPI002ACD419C|nr:MotA/TolQ/ExbB proton channel family protein [Rhodohalobacter sp.]MDZ7755019.1 MotA/TolQ/ExbB proton channel family protein [Rhodohalobacter sp.]
MIDLFFIGGPLFMGILTIILIALVATAVYIAVQRKTERSGSLPVNWLKEIGILGLVIGILGQFLGLYQAFSAIEQMGSVSQTMLAGGLKVSSITSIYGLVIFILAVLLQFGLNLTNKAQ